MGHKSVLKAVVAAGMAFTLSACATVDRMRPVGQGDSAETILAGFDLVLDKVCKPYVLEGAAAAAVVVQPGLAPTPLTITPKTLSVHPSTRLVIASLEPEANGVRTCTIFVEGGPSYATPAGDVLRARLIDWVARQPQAFTLSATPFPAGNYAKRELWCSPAGGRQYAVLASTAGPPGGFNGPHIAVSLLVGPSRDRRC
jgi:hypothetical protein